MSLACQGAGTHCLLVSFCASLHPKRYSIEDPFQGSLRLSILCDTIRRDVMGSPFRTTAFELVDDLPTSTDDDDDDDDDKEGEDDTYSPNDGKLGNQNRPNAAGGAPNLGGKPPITLPRFQKQQSPDAYQ